MEQTELTECNKCAGAGYVQKLCGSSLCAKNMRKQTMCKKCPIFGTRFRSSLCAKNVIDSGFVCRASYVQKCARFYVQKMCESKTMCKKCPRFGTRFRSNLYAKNVIDSGFVCGAGYAQKMSSRSSKHLRFFGSPARSCECLLHHFV